MEETKKINGRRVIKTFYFICTSLFQKGKGEVSSTVQSFNCLKDAFNYVKGQEKLWHDSKNNLIEFKYNPEKETLFAAYEDTHYKCAYVLTKQYLFADEINPLDEFCANEAPFRLQEIFCKSDDFVEGRPDVVKDVAGIIRHTIDYCEVLYDAIDDNIREYLEKNNLLENED